MSGIPCGNGNAHLSTKVILVGNSGVGKTCLISAYINETFDLETPPTVAPAYSNCRVKRSDGTMAVLQVWDTAGQEKFSSVSQLFFREAEVAFICFDPQDVRSVSAVKIWGEQVRNESPSCILFGIMTKADCVPQDDLPTVFETCKNKLADAGVTNFYITSARTGTGIIDPFVDAADLIKIPTDPFPLADSDDENELSMEENRCNC